MTLVSDVTPFLTAADKQISDINAANAALSATNQTQAATIASQAAQIAALQAQISSPPTTGLPALPAGWTKTLFQELFDKPLDPNIWNTRNDGGQNNNSASNLASNVTVQNGYLSIHGGKNPAGSPKPYNAGYIDTKGKKSWSGEFYAEARLRFPYGPTAYGFWPAWWMRPDDGGDGEIDMMECWPFKFQVSATIHHDYLTTSAHVPHVGKNFPTVDWTTWHTFGVEKTMGGMKFFVDGALAWDASSVAWREDIFDNTRAWHFRHCLQIGGSWGGQPTSATDFSKTYDTDYIRVLGR